LLSHHLLTESPGGPHACQIQQRALISAQKVEEIEQEALALSDGQRASLAVKLLTTLSPAGADISDEVVEQRERELASGKVSLISHAEFVRRVQRERGQ
jgi:hypothetical protein